MQHKYLTTAALVIAVLALTPQRTILASSERTLEQARQKLRDHDINPSSADILAFLKRQYLKTAEQEKLEKLIAQLGDERFSVRERAESELKKHGQLAIPSLINAKTRDLEIKLRIQRLIEMLDSQEFIDTRNELVMAALDLLKNEPHAEGFPVLLRLVDEFPQRRIYTALCEATWSTPLEKYQAELKRLLASENIDYRVLAIPAYELALGEESQSELHKYLSDTEPRIRLSAARALIDRLPNEVIPVLLDLLDCKDQRVKFGAAWLLSQMSPAEEGKTPPLLEEAARWRELATRDDLSVWQLPLGKSRLRVESFSGRFEEQFDTPTAFINKKYGKFIYQTSRGKASVVDGHLVMNGRHDESDQWLKVNAQNMFGRRDLPERFRVLAKLGGGNDGSGGYHVGVTIGRIKVLFHPGYSGGGFRVEDVMTQDYLISNKSMNFTPAGGVLHSVTVDVTAPPEKDQVNFKIEVVDGDSKKKFKTEYTCTRKVAGKFDYVGLIRSGRSGGDAVFDSFIVDLEVPEP